ncbi:RsmB/NOP family class I SAM-dependent RNA methyltransferase [Myxococcota bacterium]|nr:RsmB/NOP family class I SAM-dependent RNA methyltransferase [Myxococcota bacterium]MBU1433087.1 RsmB/NOP family class I SAM-dependent RNA methyltransferase [Myxococcota bacterium]MBU1897929.1 RsmB/NOP family class I SAM-dependent RNA methyltransferase [Myxococcota bacterium]
MIDLSCQAGVDQLRRYAPLVDDLDAFLAAAARPLDKVAWLNPLKGDVGETEALLRARCPAMIPLGWAPNAWRLPDAPQPGAWIEHLMGRLYIQEAAALWAGLLVGARPGERVLDMCASPGGKAAQIAVAMADQGTLIANERSRGRLSALRRTLDRLGVTCAAIHQGDGARLRLSEGSFDRVLVDAPCTCEGNRRPPPRPDPRLDITPPPALRATAPIDLEAQARFRASICQVQRALLRRAVRLTRPGGVILYATCTYAPEENEATLSAIPIEDAVITPIEAPEGLHVSPGVPTWGGQVYRPDVVHAARLWPHHNDTGGFFAARLIRL